MTLFDSKMKPVARDDGRLKILRRDLTAGMSSRVTPEHLAENAAVVLKNVDISVPGERTKVKGCVTKWTSAAATRIKKLFAFYVTGEEPQVICASGAYVEKSTSIDVTKTTLLSTLSDEEFVGIVGVKQAGSTPDDMIIVNNGEDNARLIDSDGNITDLLDETYSCPKTTVMHWFNNRLWCLKNDLAYYSDAYPSKWVPDQATIKGDTDHFIGLQDDKIKVTIDSDSYDDIDLSTCTSISDVVTAINTAVGLTVASVETDSTDPSYNCLKIVSTTYGQQSIATIADGTHTQRSVVNELFSKVADRTDTGYSPFDRSTHSFRIPVGKEKAIISTRTLGMIFFGELGVWALSPSASPTASDKPEPLDTRRGCVAGNTVVCVGDDIYYLAQDGIRSLKRTQQDVLSSGPEYPVSYALKEEVESINWAFADRACACYFDNRFFIAVPVDSGTYNNEVWIYYPATQSWTILTDWNVGSWCVVKVNGEERLYYGDAVNGKFKRAYFGYNNDGSAISYEEQGRREDFGDPMTNKCGGTLEVKALAIGGSATVAVYASVDCGAYQSLGTIALTATGAPELPEDLPFTLAGDDTVRETFHLDSLGPWRTIQFKFTNSDLNTGDVKILEHNCTTFSEEYFDE